MINLQDKLNYKFNDISLLNQALTHVSYSNECGDPSNDRLEFLGDAIIELVVSDYIYRLNELDSGMLSKLRASMVSTNSLSEISLSLGLNKLIKKSKSLNNLSKKNLADLFESVVGAVYLDGGFQCAKDLIEKFVIVDMHSTVQHLKNCVDFKTKLQEDMQSKKMQFEYKLTHSEGLDHDKTFEVDLIINGNIVSHGIGKSIHLAQEDSAKKFYENN